MLPAETKLHLEMTVRTGGAEVNDLAVWAFGARDELIQQVLAEVLWSMQEECLGRVWRGETELACPGCGVVHSGPAGLLRRGSRWRKVRGSVGVIRFRLRQLTCADCRKTWSPFPELMGLRPRQRVTEELVRRLVDWVTELSYAKTCRIGGEWLGSSLSPRTLHKAVQDRGAAVAFTEAEPLEVLVADGTCVPAGAKGRGEDFRVAFQIEGRTRKGNRRACRKRVVGLGIGWRSFETALATRQQPDLVVTDGESGLRQLVQKNFPNARHQLCTWHLGYSLDMTLRYDGIPFRQRAPQVKELTSILWADGRGDPQRYRAFMNKLKRYPRTWTLLNNALPYVLFERRSSERTSSIAEREMREINRRSNVGARWSVVGIFNLLRLRMAKRHNPDDYRRLWSQPRYIQAHLVPHPRCQRKELLPRRN